MSYFGFYAVSKDASINLDAVILVGKLVPNDIGFPEKYTHKAAMKGGRILLLTKKQARKLVKFLEQV